MTEPLAPVERYSRTAILLHWLHAVLILGLLILGYVLADLPKGPERSNLIGLHKSFGLCALLLVGVRLLWRQRHPAPPHLPGAAGQLAAFGHAVLYVLLVVVPLAGYLSASFTKYPMKWFGWPLLKAGWPDDGLNALFNLIHRGSAWLLAMLLLLHVGAAVWHTLRGERILQRMLPLGRR